MIALMLKLGLTTADVAADHAVVNEVIQRQAEIAAGRNTESQLAALWDQIKAHDAETQQILQQRKETIQPAYQQRAGLMNAKDNAVSAIRALQELKNKEPELLADIQVPKVEELG
jgi:hypothetical protein